MPDTEEHFVSAYFDNDDERATALKLLREPTEYEGVIEGYATREAIDQLTKQRLLVTIQKSSEPKYDDPIEQRSKYTDPELRDRLMELEQRAEDVSASSGLESIGPEGAMMDSGPPQPFPFKVLLKGPIRPQWREELGNLGAEIRSYNNGWYQMFIDPLQVEAVRALDYVKDVVDYSVTDSVSSSVLLSIEKKKEQDESGFESFGSEEEQRETFDVMVHRESDLARVVDFIKSRSDAEYVEETSSAVRFRAVPDSVVVATVAAMPEVSHIVHTAQPTLYMDRAREVVGLSRVNQAMPPKQWTGSGEVVAVLDSGIDSQHVDFEGQFAVQPISFRNCSVDDSVGHGTHVAGIIAGTGKKSNQKICGVAPGAKLVVVGMVNDMGVPQIPLDAGELFKVAVDKGARILNASWGRRLGSTYDAGSRSVDKYVYENPDVLIVVAAGNEGDAPKGTYQFKSIGAPATAKNVLTVGATNTDRELAGTWGTFRGSSFPVPNAANDPVAVNPDNVAGISSRGPTDFGSIKPDVVAPGTYIMAPRAETFGFDPRLEWKAKDKDGKPVKPESGYVFIGGTSMATPIVSGIAAVLRQYLREERNTPKPSAALMKAILISAAKPVPQRTDDLIKQIGFPDFDQGFGRIDVSLVIPDGTRRLAFVDVDNKSDLALESRAPSGGARKSSRSYRVKVATKAPLVITLAWTDPPGSDVQNNMQLDLRGPADLFTIGNASHIFRKDPNFDATAPNGMVLDKRNNVAQIRIDAAEPGEYLIRVAAQNTVLPPQGYALAVVGNLEGELVG